MSILWMGPAMSDPGDIFSISAPSLGSAPPLAASTRLGDSSVSATGAFTYSYPIKVPPGRNGMQPDLALAYSSQGSIYGGIAAGWSLAGIPIISLDTSNGRLGSSEKRFNSSMAGDRPLIPVNDGFTHVTFRAQNDNSWTRYEKMAGTSSGYPWRAKTTDGTLFIFGDADHVTRCPTVGEEYAPLTRRIDKFGNQIDYYYTAGLNLDCHIDSITWGQHANPNTGLQTFAKVQFTYAHNGQCGSGWGAQIGSQISFRSGNQITTGSMKLLSITATASPPGSPGSPEHTRVITLDYDTDAESCTAPHSAYRSLTSIQESAWRNSDPSGRVNLPAVTFTYGSADVGKGTLAWSQPQSPTTLPWQTDPIPDWMGGSYPPFANHNLGWGYRFSNGQWPTVEAMMIDIDGDGRLDRLFNTPEWGSNDQGRSGVRKCRASWQRNQGFPNSFGPLTPFYLPTLKWATRLDKPAYSGGAIAGDNQNFDSFNYTERIELCALNYQLTGYINSLNPGGNNRCPVEADNNVCGPATNYICPTTHDDCSAKHSQANPKASTLAFRWIDIDDDGKTDLIASPIDGGLIRYNLQHGNKPGAPWEPNLFGAQPFPNCPQTSSTAYPNDGSKLYTMCGGMLPWIVYKNKGNGRFGRGPAGGDPLPDQILYQPMPLETWQGESSIDSAPVSPTSGFQDIDGDGYVDAIHKPFEGAINWNVYRNGYQSQTVQLDGTTVSAAGTFLPQSGAAPYSFSVPMDAYLSYSNYGGGASGVLQTQGLLDLNSDGVVDWWAYESSNLQPWAYLNDSLHVGYPYLLSRVPGASGRPYLYTPINLSGWISDGYRRDVRRPVDMDLDGRIDQLDGGPDGSELMWTYLNQGAQYGIVTAGQIGNESSLERRILVHRRSSYYFGAARGDRAYLWEVRSDFLDLNGDSIPEGLDFALTYPNPGTMNVWRVETPTHPPRLMTGIDANRGAVTTISYASMSNDGVVVQDSVAGKTMPHSRWMVQSINVTDYGNNQPISAVTAYKYYNPRYSPDDQLHYTHRGFEKIETTTPSGAVHEKQYDYAVDWSGRVTKSITHPAEALGEARSISITTYEPRPLFDGAITTFHAVRTETLSCFNGQTEATCTPSTAAAYVKSTTTLTPMSAEVGGPALMHLPTRSLTQTGTVDKEGDRRKEYEYFIYATPLEYRVIGTKETRSHRVNGAFRTYAKTEKIWTNPATGDESYRVPYQEITWLNDNETAVLRRDYDLTTGNPTKVWKPEQYSANQFGHMTYDSRKLFVARKTNELGHVQDYTYDYGTGSLLETHGPNTPSCAANSTCPSGEPTRQLARIRVDGLGRVLERFQSFLWTNKASYKLFLVESNLYVDGVNSLTAFPPLPPSVTRWGAIDYNEYTQVIRYTKERTDVDGHGRPIRKTVFANGSSPGPEDHVTTYVYGNDGTLRSVTAPDPALNSATATVTYTYTHDSLGRPKSIRRPDTAAQSGADMTYDGVTTTVVDVLGTNGGVQAKGISINDAFGRTVEVRERKATDDTYAITKYEYDPIDNVRQITDAQGAVTTMTHDLANRRTSITRAGKTWRYGYDQNSNIISEQAPCLPVGSCEINYTTTTEYDALDRPRIKWNASGGLGAQDVVLFANEMEVFEYDMGPNAKGRLSSWKSFGPGSSTPSLQIQPQFNLQGQEIGVEQSMNVAGFTSVAPRTTQRIYNLAGNPVGTYIRDAVGTTNCQNGSYSHMSYDERGLPFSVQVNSCLYGANPPFSYMVNTRNVSGLVTRRYSASGVGPITNIESNWTYDSLGRVTSQVIRKGSALEQVARQDILYFGNDNPSTLHQWLGATNHKQFTFTYDPRNQLTNVAEAGNAFTATYAYTTAGRFGAATEATAVLPNSNVAPRAVTYQYSSTDSQQLLSLKETGNRNYALYTYDAAGNQLSREYPDTRVRVNFVYDGNNRLRRATKRVDNVVRGSEEYYYTKNDTRMLVVKRGANGNKTGMIWFLANQEAHYDATGTVTRVFSHVNMGTPVFRLDRSTDGPSKVEYQFHGLGNNTLAAVDQVTGRVNASFIYAPFGEIVEATNAGDLANEGLAVHRRRMNDKYIDEISDLAYYGYRYYDRTSMMWTQTDPEYRVVPDKSSPRAANLYAFSLNNPLRYMDPDGREARPQPLRDSGVAEFRSWLREATGRAMEFFGYHFNPGGFGTGFGRHGLGGSVFGQGGHIPGANGEVILCNDNPGFCNAWRNNPSSSGDSTDLPATLGTGSAPADDVCDGTATLPDPVVPDKDLDPGNPGAAKIGKVLPLAMYAANAVGTITAKTVFSFVWNMRGVAMGPLDLGSTSPDIGSRDTLKSISGKPVVVGDDGRLRYRTAPVMADLGGGYKVGIADYCSHMTLVKSGREVSEGLRAPTASGAVLGPLRANVQFQWAARQVETQSSIAIDPILDMQLGGGLSPAF